MNAGDLNQRHEGKLISNHWILKSSNTTLYTDVGLLSDTQNWAEQGITGQVQLMLLGEEYNYQH